MAMLDPVFRFIYDFVLLPILGFLRCDSSWLCSYSVLYPSRLKCQPWEDGQMAERSEPALRLNVCLNRCMMLRRHLITTYT